MTRFHIFVTCCVALVATPPLAADELPRLKYNHPGLTVDLGVGLWAWPLPMDYDGDGDLDLVVSCPDKPYSGTYFFENPGPSGARFPTFKAAVRVGPALPNAQLSQINGQARVLVPGAEVIADAESRFGGRRKISSTANIHPNRVRANQWRYVDYDGDARTDLVVGIEDWTDYGWDDAFNARGEWTHGPLHGLIYWLRNTGSDDTPKYESPVKVEAAGQPVDVFGMPSPSFADFDGDGDLDLLCGEFLDGFTYFENIGTRTEPRYAAGRRLTHDSRPLRMDLQMTTPVAIDWDGDGDSDLIVGDEDGRVALIEHTGEVRDRLPVFLPPRYFQQEADDVKFGALVTPVSFDWDGDGDEDLICGNTAGYIGFIENLDGGHPPRWAAPRLLEADGRTIRIMAGPNGSIQGPAEAKWGYTTLSVADWNHDELPDIVANSIWGKVIWFQNIGTRTNPGLTAARPIEVEWNSAPPKPAWVWWTPQGRELVTQWRTTPCVLDWTSDSLNDLVMLDHEGYLALFERTRLDGQLRLLPGRRMFVGENGEPLRLNAGHAGKSGRRQFRFADWDGDGRLDLLLDGKNVNVWRNVRTNSDGTVVLVDHGPVSDHVLAGHTTSPTLVDWDRNGIPDMLIGAEDGRLYFLRNPRAAK